MRVRGQSGAARDTSVRTALALAGGLLPTMALAQTVPPPATLRPPVAPSQVTPRSLRPAPAAPAAPLDLDEGAPASAPKGADDIHLTIAAAVVDGGFPELATQTDAVLAPFAGQRVSVGDLYRAAGRIEKLYADAGFFLARVVVARQRLVDGATFRITVIDGYIEQIDVSALPWRVRRPVRAILSPTLDVRHLRLDEMQRRLDAAGAVPGIVLKSTLGRGERPGGVRLILDGRFKLAGLSIDIDNRLGRSFRNWGLSLQGQINSPFGGGEQFYAVFAGAPRVDRAFKGDALRRVGGVGALVPIGGDGLLFNPEFTISDTHPLAADPILATDGRLYRGSLNLSAPVLATRAGILSVKLSADAVSETQTLPFFALTFYRDRLVIARAGLAWEGRIGGRTSLFANATLSQGLDVPGARSRRSIAASFAPTSRGSDPQFTRIEARVQIGQPLPAGFGLDVVGYAQTSFGTVVPNSETFDITGLDGLSSFSAGALIADGGQSVRAELSRPLVAQPSGLQLQVAPYVYAAGGGLHLVLDDPLTPTRGYSYGAGLRFAGGGFPLGARPHVTLEYGRGHANRGLRASNRLSVAAGVTF